MKKYIKPCAEMIVIETTSQLLADSGIGLHDELGDGNTGQLSRRKKDIVIDDEDDGGDGFGW